MEQIYNNLVSRALEKHQLHQNEESTLKRIIIALSGPPGSGKSTIAATVVKRLNSLYTESFAITVPMDGFHYPKKYLDTLPNRTEAYARRGAHWTFDAKGVVDLVKTLHDSKTNSKGTIRAPQFDHLVGDPIENAICISPEISVIILEGNYLAYNVSPWSEICNYVDDIWFVEVDPKIARNRIAKRHIESGIEKTWEDAIRRVENNDLPNGADVRAHLIKPNVIVQSIDEA